MSFVVFRTGKRLWQRVRGKRGSRERLREGVNLPKAPILVGVALAAGIGFYFLAWRRRHRGAAAVEQAKPSARRPEELNDPALEAKVESEIFRRADVPRQRVNVSVERGVVYLRGELASADEIEELASAAAGVEGVRTVENLLHLPGEEAPAKASGHDRGGPKRAGARG